MDWLQNNIVNVFSLLFGTGGIGYAVVSRTLDKRKYEQEVRDAEAVADLKGDEFWKKRYDVLQQEVENKDGWWKERYDALSAEYQKERQLSNDIIKSFRTELTEMRQDYERQREAERLKYENLRKQYRDFEEESEKREGEYKARISQLESLINDYENKLNKK